MLLGMASMTRRPTFATLLLGNFALNSYYIIPAKN